MKKTLWFGALQTVSASLLLSLVACETNTPAEYPPEHSSVQDPAPAVSAALPSSTPGTGWASAAPDNVVTEIEGKPIVLGAGEHCKNYRRLPSLHFSKSALVKDACLELPDNTVIDVLDGATLAIVATSSLRIGKNVVFRAKGHSGNRGARSRFASVPYTPPSDLEIQAMCAENAAACACPSDETTLSTLRAQAGSDGSAGGSVRLMAAELLSPTNLKDFAIDVSGGDPGPAGESGVRQCTRGAVSCASQACATGIRLATAGTDGRVTVAFGGVKSAALVRAARAAVTPTNGSTELAWDSTFAEQTSHIDAEALQKGWQRRSGEEP